MLKEIKTHGAYFLKNRWFVLLTVLSAILGYGYLWMHGTCGIDDVSIDLYFEKGIGVAIGRWPYYLINKIIPIAEYTPFIGDFITVAVMLIAAIVWCILLRMLITQSVSIWAYIVFVFVFMDYSMNADIFVFYLQNGLGWVHLFSVISLIAFLHLQYNQEKIKKQILIRSVVIVLLTIAISFYESAANVFLTGALIVVLIDLFVKKQESAFRGMGFLKSMFFVGRYLVYAMVARRIVRSIIMRMFHIAPYVFYRSASNIDWLLKGDIENIWEKIEYLLAQIYCDYFAVGVVYYPILIFVVCSFVFMVSVVFVSLKRKDFLLFLTGIGVYISLFVLCFIEGYSMAYRACQAFVIFVAIVFGGMAIALDGSSGLKKKAGGCVIAIALLYSIYDMNQMFALDYEKTEYEMQVLDEIAQELNSGKYNVKEKPLVFVGNFELPDTIYNKYCIEKNDFGWKIVEKAATNAERYVEGRYCYGQNAASIIDWSIHAFESFCGYNVPIHQLLEYRGYDFLKPDDATVRAVFETHYTPDWKEWFYYVEDYNGAAEYPAEGYIEEQEDCIVIRL